MDNKFIKRVIEDVKWYAKEYNCTILESIQDWEGDGPSGGWGLTANEQYEIAHEIEMGE